MYAPFWCGFVLYLYWLIILFSLIDWQMLILHRDKTSLFGFCLCTLDSVLSRVLWLGFELRLLAIGLARSQCLLVTSESHPSDACGFFFFLYSGKFWIFSAKYTSAYNVKGQKQQISLVLIIFSGCYYHHYTSQWPARCLCFIKTCHFLKITLGWYKNDMTLSGFRTIRPLSQLCSMATLIDDSRHIV